ncbi:TetR/AcrR family transcriptional regulator [uncultured Pseudacidovorax sp.]|uniref:TetR/AcrR family transcriptional regulator n=1 Tax=uncultured Pseudacidovorax sp. TaxID=679313 RepID=UPI0025F5B8C7|nr:TetR family transcriptional regulator [uncultured Pseudacidovorax sp.]
MTDLRARLLDAAIALMTDGEEPTLRAVARRAGVSAMAPYRHFIDRDALVDAAAVSGLYLLKAALRGGADGPIVGIVRFAIARPVVARLLLDTPAGRAGLDDLLGGAEPARTQRLALVFGLVRLVLAGDGERALAAVRTGGAGGGDA